MNFVRGLVSGYYRYWLNYRVVIFVLSLAPFLIPGPWLPDSKIMAIVPDLLHYPVFMLLGTYLFSNIKRSYRNLIIVGILIIVMEFSQPLIGRSLSIIDILSGLMGIITAYIISFKNLNNTKLTASAIIIGIYTYWVINSLFFPLTKSMNSEELGGFDWHWDIYGWNNINDIKSYDLKIVTSKTLNSKVLKGNKLNYTWSGVTYEWIIPARFSKNANLNFQFYPERFLSELDIKISYVDGTSKINSISNFESNWQEIKVPIYATKYSNDTELIKQISIYYESKEGPGWYKIDDVIIK